MALALIALANGDTQQGAQLYTHIKEFPGFMAPDFYMSTDRVLGLLSAMNGDLDDSRRHFEDALSFCRKAGYRPELAWTCHDYAAMLLGESTGATRVASAEREKAVSLVQDGLGIATAIGMRPLAAKLTSLAEKAAADRGGPQYPDGLSEREVEVLRLIAAGKTNQQIADALIISRFTVVRHVTNIFTKTGASNRADATSYAHRHGLADAAGGKDRRP
jgi:DNA-binding CsgD family transcriptional regulator